MSRGGRLHTLRTSEDVEQACLFSWLKLTRWQGRPLVDLACIRRTGAVVTRSKR